MNDKSKKSDVIKELGPIADVLNITLDYVIDDDNRREYLVCNGQKICTNGTSVYGIRQEFFGYVFLQVWRDRTISPFEKQTRNFIKQYWYDDNFHQPYLKNS